MIRYAISAGDARERGKLVEDARRWAADGIDFVQLREKHLAGGEMAALAREMMRVFQGEAARGSGLRVKLLVNGRADVAVAAGADGVHLAANAGELTPAQVRRVFALAGEAAPVVSVSCHALDEVRRAHGEGVDMILFGPVFEKRVDGDLVAAGSGLEALRQACEMAAGTRVVALGGVTLANAAACVAAGAAGFAGIRMFR